MMTLKVTCSLLFVLFLFGRCSARRQPPTALELCEDNFRYTFEEFITDFDRNYDPTEYNVRKEIFERNIQTVIQHNVQYVMQRKQQQQASSERANKSDGTSTISGDMSTMNSMARRQAKFEQILSATAHQQENENNELWKPESFSHLLGINDFMDRLPEELPRGYDSMQSSRVRSSSSVLANQINAGLDVVSDVTAIARRRNLLQRESSEQALLKALGGAMVHVSELPEAVDWRMRGVTTPVKNQGGCGSCWAFASTAVLESHIALQTNVLLELSEQELVSCAPNPRKCGGVGGCAGATAEIAFELVRRHGMVEEWQFGYNDFHGSPVNCTLALGTSSLNSTFVRNRFKDSGEASDKQFYKGAVVTIQDYIVLPSNNYTSLMNVVAKLGPVTVSVACMPWQFYRSGVFHVPLVPGKATDIDHLVVLEGYGTDQESGEPYWLVRNSWGPFWGEGGYIRLKRSSDEECAMDNTPEDGNACTIDEDGNQISPAPQSICGNSGILFDTAIPLGGSFV
jgi:cathepsin L